MMTEEIKRIYKNVSAVYDGSPWHGENIVSFLSNLPAKMAEVKPDKLNHSIAEIVSHMAAWRYFVIEKMKGNAEYEVWDTELNWQNITTLNEAEWQTIKDNLQKSQAELLAKVEEMNESMLTSPVEGRKYNFRLLLQGIVQHDIYHAGQISLIKKLVGSSCAL